MSNEAETRLVSINNGRPQALPPWGRNVLIRTITWLIGPPSYFHVVLGFLDHRRKQPGTYGLLDRRLDVTCHAVATPLPYLGIAGRWPSATTRYGREQQGMSDLFDIFRNFPIRISRQPVLQRRTPTRSAYRYRLIGLAKGGYGRVEDVTGIGCSVGWSKHGRG